uniref:Chromosome segregation DNA-binding protein n=1 Tax=Chlorobium chlorochromatii (strain CaD3) TaxID=340177 RepID=Q3APM0_CHLCH
MGEMQKKGLGRGLKALIPDELMPDEQVVVQPPETSPSEPATVGSICSLPVEKIHANPFQPRKEFDATALEELKNSIIENGVIQPITVWRNGDIYQLVSGERRLRAVTLAGFKFIPAYLIEAPEDSAQIEMALIENIQREDLNAIEVALALKSLTTRCNLSHEEVARKVGKNRSTISNLLRLLKLPLSIQESIRNHDISSGHARALINLPTEQQQLKVWKQILSQQLSVRQTEALVNRLANEQEQSTQPPRERATRLAALEAYLRDNLATKVKIVEKKDGKGEIHIQYFSHDDLERLLEFMRRD